jgi:hypothetical protein
MLVHDRRTCLQEAHRKNAFAGGTQTKSMCVQEAPKQRTHLQEAHRQRTCVCRKHTNKDRVCRRNTNKVRVCTGSTHKKRVCRKHTNNKRVCRKHTNKECICRKHTSKNVCVQEAHRYFVQEARKQKTCVCRKHTDSLCRKHKNNKSVCAGRTQIEWLAFPPVLLQLRFEGGAGAGVDAGLGPSEAWLRAMLWDPKPHCNGGVDGGMALHEITWLQVNLPIGMRSDDCRLIYQSARDPLIAGYFTNWHEISWLQVNLPIGMRSVDCRIYQLAWDQLIAGWFTNWHEISWLQVDLPIGMRSVDCRLNYQLAWDQLIVGYKFANWDNWVDDLRPVSCASKIPTWQGHEITRVKI